MIGAFNKLFRNAAAFKGKGEFDKKLIKASYSGDMKEPKEKHVMFILECLKGKHLELIRPKDALRKVSDRFFTNLRSISLMIKALIILHRALQEEDISQTVAHKIKEMENILQPCQNDDQSYDIKMQCFISDLYINYIKNLINFIIISQLFQISLKDLHHYSRSLTLLELFLIFNRIDTLIESILKVFQQKAYCQNYRLFHSVIYLLFVDLLKIYQSYYLLITVMLDKFEEMDLKDAKRAFIIYLSFIKINREIRKMAAVIIQEFNIKLKIYFYDIDAKVAEALKQSIEIKEKKLRRESHESVETSLGYTTMASPSTFGVKLKIEKIEYLTENKQRRKSNFMFEVQGGQGVQLPFEEEDFDNVHRMATVDLQYFQHQDIINNFKISSRKGSAHPELNNLAQKQMQQQIQQNEKILLKYGVEESIVQIEDKNTQPSLLKKNSHSDNDLQMLGLRKYKSNADRNNIEEQKVQSTEQYRFSLSDDEGFKSIIIDDDIYEQNYQDKILPSKESFFDADSFILQKESNKENKNTINNNKFTVHLQSDTKTNQYNFQDEDSFQSCNGL